MDRPEAGNLPSLFSTASARRRKRKAAEGLSRRIYVRAERNCERAEGVKRIFTGLIFGKHSVRFSQNRG